MGRRILVAALLLPTLAGCGGSSDEPLAREDGAALLAPLAEAREAAAEDDPEGAREALGEFRRTVAKLERARRIHPRDADVLRRTARQAQERIEVPEPEPEPQPEAEPQPERPVSPDEDEEEEESGEKGEKGEEKGRGEKGEDKGTGKKGKAKGRDDD